MRIYEFAKQHNLTSKELIHFLKQHDFAVGNHMSILGPEEIAAITKAYKLSENDAHVSSQETALFDNAHEQLREEAPDKVVVDAQAKKSTRISPSSKALPSASKRDEVPRYKDASTDGVRVHQQLQERDAKINDKLENSTHDQPTLVAAEAPFLIESLSVGALAAKLQKPFTEIILQLLKMGIVATKNQLVPSEAVARVARLYGINPVKPIATTHEQKATKAVVESVENMSDERMPVVVVLGHVDHGKTTLLDFIRKTRVAAKEKGGITQHIGAYEAATEHGNVVFIDTPGHQAFSKIRQRGIRVADIAVIVVAADDGVMPQTIEAIKQAQAMNVTIIVAINKVDKADATRLDIVKRQISQQGLLPEEWGGDIVCVPISAKTGQGIDKLLEMIVLHAHLLELKTNKAVPGRGYILESKIERGRGPVATLIAQHGTVKVGDYFVCSAVTGRINSLVDSAGRVCDSAGPSVPVQISGFDKLPDVGDFFKVVSRDEYRAAKANTRDMRSGALLGNRIQQAGAHNIIIKTDTDSSKEALIDAIEALSKKSDKGINIIHAAIGAVNESDVELAFNTDAAIYTLHTKIDASAVALSLHRKVVVHQFDIIYKLLEYLQEQIEARKEVVFVRKKIGQAVVLRVFDIKNIGVIAGSIVKEGRFLKEGIVVAVRNGHKIAEGAIKSLQREKKTVKEVHTGFECGFLVDGISDWQVDDVAECYISVPDTKK